AGGAGAGAVEAGELRTRRRAAREVVPDLRHVRDVLVLPSGDRRPADALADRDPGTLRRRADVVVQPEDVLVRIEQVDPHPVVAVVRRLDRLHRLAQDRVREVPLLAHLLQPLHQIPSVQHPGFTSGRKVQKSLPAWSTPAAIARAPCAPSRPSLRRAARSPGPPPGRDRARYGTAAPRSPGRRPSGRRSRPAAYGVRARAASPARPRARGGAPSPPRSARPAASPAPRTPAPGRGPASPARRSCPAAAGAPRDGPRRRDTRTRPRSGRGADPTGSGPGPSSWDEVGLGTELAHERRDQPRRA